MRATTLHRLSVFSLICASGLGLFATLAPQQQDPRAWVEASNRHAQVLLDVFAQLAPEGAAQIGVPGLDAEVTRLTAAALQRQRDALDAAHAKLQALLGTEQDALVRQDLEILIRSARNGLRGMQLQQDRLLPYTDVTALIYGGLRSLLDDQVPAERRSIALVRLRKYAGLVEGYEPISAQAMRRTRERLSDPKLLAPPRPQVERDLSNAPILVRGIAKLFERYKIEGWREAFAALERQLSEYEQFVRTEVLPKARVDFRLPPDLYAFSLEQVGVTMEPEPLAQMARQGFEEIQAEMRRLAPEVTKARSLESTDYRDVIRELKKAQLVGEAILPHYRKRLEEIEAIIRREKLVTLPQRDARIRIATDAEAAQTPAPNMRPPRLLGNTGELGEFVLPLNIPSKTGAQQFDDFTFEAASLDAHGS